MSDPALDGLIAQLSGGEGPDLNDPVDKLRPEYDALFASFPVAEDLSFADEELGGVPCIRASVPGSDSGKLVLYLHGGGYVVGTASGYRSLASEIARAAGMDAVIADYRLAPEHKFPTAVDDALAVFLALRESGVAASHIVLAGDSAGGGLVLATMLKLRELGEDLPAAGFLISPWADATLTAPSVEGKADVDPILDKEGLAVCVDHYMGDSDPAHPLASPALADLSGLPPLLVQVGSIEVLLDDALAITANAGAADVHVQLEVLPGLPHVFHTFHFMLPQAKAALDRAGAFLSSHAG